jgi:hypothetical protein
MVSKSSPDFLSSNMINSEISVLAYTSVYISSNTIELQPILYAISSICCIPVSKSKTNSLPFKRILDKSISESILFRT